MVKVFQGTEHEYYMDGILQDNFNMAKKVIQKDWDMVFIVDGFEGTGKSVLAQQLGFYCDPALNIDRIVFTPDGFKKAVLNSKKYQSVIYDEAYGGLSGKGTMTKVNKALVKMLTEIRQRNLFIFIVLPTLFELTKYVAIWRSRALLHVYAGDNFKRGFFAFYNVNKKKSLYMTGKKFYSYSFPDPNFTGRFYNHFTVNRDAYNKKKLEETSKDEGEEDITSKYKIRYDKMIRRASLNLDKTGYNQGQIAKILGISQQRVCQILGEFKLNDEFEQKESLLIAKPPILY